MFELRRRRSNIATRYRAICTIEDPGTRQRWILLQNLVRPAAPALLVQRPRNFSCVRFSPQGSESHSQPDSESRSLPVIHAGDYLILSEHTRFLDAELEAIALQPAAIGDSLTVRLKFGDRILRVIATAPGRAALSGEGSEARR